MKERITAAILIVLFIMFSVFVCIINKRQTVISVLSPTKLTVTSRNKVENICVDVDAFTLEPDDNFVSIYTKNLGLTRADLISLGYLADEFAQKTLTNKSISVKYLNKVTNECKYADIKLKGMSYANILKSHGYAVSENMSTNKEFRSNLEKARKLDLVILNHHSDKYHTLDCPYGNAAHDIVIIPSGQLPRTAKPCRFCHDVINKSKLKTSKNINIIPPKAIISDGYIKIINTDSTLKKKPDKNCTTTACKLLVSLINDAYASIDIAIYGYDDIPAVTNALIKAKSRGVKIRFIYDEYYNPDKNYYRSNYIISDIADTSRSDRTFSKTDSDMLMHNKFIIFDNSVVYTGSANISMSAMSDYDVNTVLVLKSPEIAHLYTNEFEQMLLGKFHKNKSKITANNTFHIGNSAVEIYFSPKDTPVSRIIQLVNSARDYIFIPTFLITQNELSVALINARKRGVDVRIITDANSPYTTNSKNGLLRSNNILLKTENFGGKLHSKSMIIDDKYIIAGSMNFSNSGNTKNDENMIVIENTNFAKAYKQFFLYLWTKIPNKYLKFNAKAEGPESGSSCSDGIDNNFNGKIDTEEEFCKEK